MIRSPWTLSNLNFKILDYNLQDLNHLVLSFKILDIGKHFSWLPNYKMIYRRVQVQITTQIKNIHNKCNQNLEHRFLLTITLYFYN